ncbi:MAG: 16S rRNA (uracil(1498)-N(3))-methyltransferase [Fibrobacter sp.]|jgi:16S rRNA (uracil1498-N3)-methyltransferase|nr:16S rRNA (uracil(1498)-N(3))-methyltransferase [Fibrobacter sp.]
MKSPDTHFFHPDLHAGKHFLLADEAHHAIKVYRAKLGTVLNLCDGKGSFAKAEIVDIHSNGCEIWIREEPVFQKPKPLLSLAIACLKEEAIQDFVFHATQTELDQITFLRTDYSQEPKKSNCQKIIRKAEAKSLVGLKQSKKAWLTSINGPLPFHEWLKSYSGDLIFADIHGVSAANLKALERNTTLLVGPEGGFSEAEIQKIQSFQNGAVQSLQLGNSRLRAQTAAIMAVGALLGLL